MSLGLASPTFAQPQAAPFKRPKIVFFTPNSPGNTYWPMVFEVMDEVARDLHIDFIHYDLGVRSPSSHVHEEALRLLESGPKPDALMVAVDMNGARPILEKAESRQIPVYLQGPLFPHELPMIGGEPGAKFKQWVGYYQQDDFQKGLELGRMLIAKAREQRCFASDGKIHILGVGGLKSWYGSTLRENGLKQAVSENPDAILHQVAATDWTTERGFDVTMRMLKRFPEVSVVWASSDQLALAAADALEKNGKILGKNAFTGGLDLSRRGLEGLKTGRMEGSVSSTFMMFVQVMVRLFDHVNGFDARGDGGTQIIPEIHRANRHNVSSFLDLMNQVKKADFRKFSKAYNRDLKSYNFSLEHL